MDKINRKNHARRKWVLGLLIAGAALAAVLLALPRLGAEDPPKRPVETTPATRPVVTGPLTETQEPVELGSGLTIEMMDRYAGIYMEDGTDDIVQDVMMLLIRNTSEQDLQLARIQVHYADFTAEFEVTNLPAGAGAVVLERNRHGVVSGSYLSIDTQNVVFFPQPMDLMPDRLELGGATGVVEVTNISGEDLTGPVYIYYKNSAEDLFYGGITYRVTISDGLTAGETVRVPAGHYDPEGCSFVLADCAG